MNEEEVNEQGTISRPIERLAITPPMSDNRSPTEWKKEKVFEDQEVQSTSNKKFDTQE